MTRATIVCTVIDDIDREIIRELRRDARLTQREIGRAVGLSPNAAGARVQRLVKDGVISGFHARVDHAALGRPLEATIDVWLDDRRDKESFEDLVADDDRVTECFHLTGPLDFRVRAMFSTTDDLNDLLIRMQTEAGVRQTDSRLVLEQIAVHPGA